MKLVVGLGNPGREYSQTRHNVGYLVLAELATRWSGDKSSGGKSGGERPKSRFHADTLDVVIAGERALLLCPTTYMNRSGLAVGEAVAFYKLSPCDVLVICDDMDLPFGKLRFRERGSSGGQKGLRDVLRVMGTEDVSRLRIGIGRPPDRMDAADHVLTAFTESERATLPQLFFEAVRAVELWTTQGATTAMNQTNRSDEPSP